MSDIPPHVLPKYTNASREDALFHYTTANGLIGIFGAGEMWSTAYYCASDESELATGKGVLSPLFRSKTFEMIDANDPRVLIFRGRGVDIRQYADQFERQITAIALNSLCAYITCFCKPSCEEDFYHGLLSQWRGYGTDGGYALHFSRKKLLAAIENANNAHGYASFWRAEEIRRLKAAMRRGLEQSPYQKSFASRIEHAKQMARAEDEPIYGIYIHE